ncbi:MAG: SUMF1/EgtB/PvdO family nonheme iron enzyme [Fidelibacterota bacterium]
MKKIIFFMTLLFVFVNCEREWNNPFDSSAQINKAQWTPSNLKAEQTSLGTAILTWQSVDKNIEGYKIDRKLNDGEWNEELLTITDHASGTMEITDSTIIPDPDFTYTYRLYAFAGWNESNQVTGQIRVEFPPVTNLTLEALSPSVNLLQWQDNANGEDGYVIERKVDAGNWTDYATLPENATHYADSAVAVDQMNYYRVSAFYGMTRSKSVEISMSSEFSAPLEFNIVRQSITSVKLAWQDNTDGEDGFYIDRKTGNGEWERKYASVAQNETEYLDESLQPDETYNYSVYAYSGDIVSDKVSQSIILTFEAPGDLTSQIIDNSTVKLSWTNHCDFDHRVSVERRLEGGNFETIALLDRGTFEYLDQGVDSTATYEYAVRAFAEPYYSEYSNIITVQPLPPLPFEMVEVMAGNFTYGSADDVRTINYDYVIMKYEVTNQQYAEYLQEAFNKSLITVTSNAVMGDFNGDEKFSSGEYLYFDLGDENARIYFSNDQFHANSDYSDHPVTQVTWFGAHAFAEYYRGKLPSEEEWEKAARGNTGNQYPWGDDYDSHYCNHQCSGYPESDGTTPVGFYDGMPHDGYSTLDNSSYYGAYDMAGNVWELTRDYYPESTDKHTVRGGSWYNTEAFIFTYSRLKQNSEKGNSYVGFRIMRKQ